MPPKLRRGNLYGRAAYEVWDSDVMLGWVVQKSIWVSPHNREWAAVPKIHDQFADLEYWFHSRKTAVASLTERITPMLNDLDKVLKVLRDAQIQLELLILKTPTSERRNLLTEANIFIEEAVQSLKRSTT